MIPVSPRRMKVPGSRLAKDCETRDPETRVQPARFLLPLLLASAGLLLPLCSARAELLAGWDAQGFTFRTVPPTLTPKVWSETVDDPTYGVIGSVTVAPAVQIIEGLAPGPELKPSELNNAWGAGLFDQTSQAEAISAGQYFTVTIAPQKGSTISLTDLEFNLRMNASGLTYAYIWQYAMEGREFTDIGTPCEGVTTDTLGMALPKVDLSGIPELQNLRTPVTFRLVSWKTNPEAFPGGYFVIFGRLPGNDLTINGTQSKAVP
ncbi:MAG TPA: hypothetical protein PLS03_03975 [Terrimicrobiaceae bacterium]|nr:hypothetical protein [Terrimicrobiaceae bacterium]